MTRSTTSGARRPRISGPESNAEAAAFARRVITVVRRIPPGRVATYGDVAAMAGRPTAWRAVGGIMRRCTAPGVPCHRVVGSGGRLGGYHDPMVKRQLLAGDGIHVAGRRLRHFPQVRWHQP